MCDRTACGTTTRKRRFFLDVQLPLSQILLQVLLTKGATVNVVNHWNLTPLATAVTSNQHKAAQLLREHSGLLCSKMPKSFYPVHAATLTGTSV